MVIKKILSGKAKYITLIFVILVIFFLLIIHGYSGTQHQIPDNNSYDISKKQILKNVNSDNFNEKFKTLNIHSDIHPVFSTYFGGIEEDSVNSVSINAENNLIAITGVTQSKDFPLTEENPKERPGNIDGFLAILNSQSKELLYSTFIGGKGSDKPVSTVFDNNGHLYVAGYTNSDDFPVTNNALQKNIGGKWDLFILSVNVSDFTTKYSTYIGGSSSDVVHDIEIDNNNYLYITGTTESEDFPTTKGAFQEEITGKRDAFLIKFNPRDKNIVYSTLFGGVSDDYSEAVGIDSDFNAYITGYTYSSKTRSLPVKNKLFDPSPFSYDSYIAAFNQEGSDLIFSTYIGGGGGDRAKGIVVSDDNRIYIAGYTYSRDFPVKKAIQSNYSGSGTADGFLTCLNADGSEVIFSTYFGKEKDDFIHAICSDNKGNIILAGESKSDDLLSFNEYDNEDINPEKNELNNNFDGFIAVLSEDGKDINSVTMIQGGNYDVINDIDESDGRYIIAGKTKSEDFPTYQPIQRLNAGSYDGFILEFILKV